MKRRGFLVMLAALVAAPATAHGRDEVPEFTSATCGFVDFGRGKLAVLHGMEGVFSPAQIEAIRSASYQAGRL